MRWATVICRVRMPTAPVLTIGAGGGDTGGRVASSRFASSRWSTMRTAIAFA
ncbi:MAG: hypothetical protein ACK56I_20735 [bacterium]